MGVWVSGYMYVQLLDIEFEFTQFIRANLTFCLA